MSENLAWIPIGLLLATMAYIIFFWVPPEWRPGGYMYESKKKEAEEKQDE